MRICRRCAIILAILFTFAVARSEPDWTGKSVVVKRADVTAQGGKAGTDQIELKQIVYEVLQEKQGYLLIEERGAKAWVEKSQTLLASEGADYFTEQMRKDPKNADSYARRGTVNLNNSNYEKAKLDFDEALRLNPKVAAWWDIRASISRRLGQREQALADIEQAVALEPSEPNYVLIRGWLKYSNSDDEGALADATTVLRLDANESNAHFLRAYVWFFLKREAERAIEPATAAIKLLPKNADAYDLRGSAFLATEEPEKAISDFAEAVRLNATAHRYRNLASAEIMAERYKSAIANLDSAQKLEPKSPETYSLRGKCRMELGDDKAALVDFEEALKIEATDWGGLMGRGMIHARQKKYTSALLYFEQAVEHHPTESLGYQRLALLRATCPDDDIRNGEKAIAAARKGCEISNWGSAFGFLCLAAAYAETGDFESAVSWQEKAMADKLLTKERGEEAKQMLDNFRNKRPWRSR